MHGGQDTFRRESDLGWGEEGDQVGKLGWGQALWILECQGEKYTKRHLEYSLKGAAKVSKLAVRPLEKKVRKDANTSREEGIRPDYFQNTLKW